MLRLTGNSQRSAALNKVGNLTSKSVSSPPAAPTPTPPPTPASTRSAKSQATAPPTPTPSPTSPPSSDKPRQADAEAGFPELVIEDGVPIPARRGPGARHPYALKVRELKVGQSLYVKGINRAKDLHSYASSCRKQFPARRFTVRTDVAGARIWRTV